MAAIIIIVLLIILGLGVFLFKILKEETTIIEEEKKEEEEIRLKNRVIPYIELIEEKGIDNVIESIRNNPNELDRLRHEMQSEVRKASKTGDMEKVRKFNSYLKKIDEHN